MITATSKLILSPLAEAVSQLILIISESDMNRSPMPDLTDLAKAVHSQILNLVNVANKIKAGSNDEQIKVEMNKGCEEGILI